MWRWRCGGEGEGVVVRVGVWCWGWGLTYAHILVFLLCRGIAVETLLAQLAVLPPGVVLAPHAYDRV